MVFLNYFLDKDTHVQYKNTQVKFLQVPGMISWAPKKKKQLPLIITENSAYMHVKRLL